MFTQHPTQPWSHSALPSFLLYVKSNLFSYYYVCRLSIISICSITDLCCSVKIQKITVPSVVVMDYNINLSERPNLSAPEFILDCDFDVDENEEGLVIKWFLNNKLVYQWIPPGLPIALSFLKNRIKKNFTVSDDPIKKYRGVAVTKPMLNFSGEYMCSVQTFQSSDKKSSFLQIIGKFNLPLCIDKRSNLFFFVIVHSTNPHRITPCDFWIFLFCYLLYFHSLCWSWSIALLSRAEKYWR